MDSNEKFNKYLGIAALILGILILIFPTLLRWIIGIILIYWGIMQIVLTSQKKPKTQKDKRKN